MGELQTDVLYAADVFKDGKLRPVRVLDTRRWTCTPSPDRSGLQWRLNDLNDDTPHDAVFGMACLYWSATDPDPDGPALLDYPWEPLPENPDEAAAELTNRARDITPGHQSVWLCLRPILRPRITARWEEPDQRADHTEPDPAWNNRQAAWAAASARLAALGLGSIHYDGTGYQAPIALDQITALLDRAEQANPQ
ncbi:hypothetical protein [Streptomyces bluensis]|uniref:Uncharacterized protein n=1 Tax=Streptomyces bluensis TaxID=33897 RepID=A0ABW6UUW1_9ACTN